ncbi:MAG: altronate dehydratase [Oscillospiraceae bacterium]|nr:altronate dehydratase [Oscillospiraceae bacterium]
MNNTLIINEKDNIAVCLAGNDTIPAGHKIALRDIAQGDFVIKYGQIIGRATQDIKAGEWVHTHNLRSHLDEDVAYSYHFQAKTFPATRQSFRGFARKGRRAGIRNEIYIIPSVGCVNNVCLRLAKEAQALISGSLDGIFALTHPFGCSQLGQDQENIKHLLSAIAQNPNASFVLFVGLGCENNGLDGIKECLADLPNEHIAYLNCQDVADEHEAGMAILKDFAVRAAALERVDVDLSQLCIGLKCGGSDGYSGLTANPLVGRVCDRVVSAGGSAILTEVPEMFGAEQLLMDKCATQAVFERYKAMIVDFKQSYIAQGFPVYENPSPGNKKGGITTLEEKSLGCVEKAGSTAIVDVLDYGQLVSKQGVSALNAPGNDLIAATALAASGCQVVLFTTGRGTPFSTFVPTMKIATNTPLAQKKSGWIDFDAYPMDEDALFDLLLRTASGEYRCKSEDVREIAFYKTGVTL